MNLLSYTYQWIELPPYHGNVIKRLSDKRKGYFTYTGIAAHLMRIGSPETLVTSLKLGPLFETWVINYIQALFARGQEANMYHWRSHSGAEVDLILERDGALYPIEIKCKSRPVRADASSLRAFQKTYPNQKVMPGLIIHAGDETYPLDQDVLALSWKAL